MFASVFLERGQGRGFLSGAASSAGCFLEGDGCPMPSDVWWLWDKHGAPMVS